MCVFLESGGFLGGWMCVFLESGASREAGCAYFSSEEALISIFTENPCVKTSIPAVVFFFGEASGRREISTFSHLLPSRSRNTHVQEIAAGTPPYRTQ
jgi:hypothetical protein